jgi:phosphatidylinositol alpha 1,6-mannosyltransferase
MTKFLYRSYVAMGDSLTEGLGDTGFYQDRANKGWADRLAGLLAREAAFAGHSFDYANLALRGSNSLHILTAQLELALELKADLVTIMTGANDLSWLPWRKKAIDHMLRGALARLYEVGSHVVLINTVRPAHTSLAKIMIHRSREMSNIIARIASEFGTPVVDVHSMREFEYLNFWASDLVHFSSNGHTRITNEVASALAIDVRDETPHVAGRTRLGVREFFAWLFNDVIPFWGRKLRGVTSGFGRRPKHTAYVRMIERPVVCPSVYPAGEPFSERVDV